MLSGAAIALFATVFFLLDGERIWAWLRVPVPRRSQDGVHEVGQRSWLVLTAYVRGTVLIAFVDAVSIGLALGVILRVPLAVPLAALVFFGAFVPIVGAFVSGFVAVVVALATRGPVAALLVLVGDHRRSSRSRDTCCSRWSWAAWCACTRSASSWRSPPAACWPAWSVRSSRCRWPRS